MQKILLLEDDANLREPLAQYLEDHGFSVFQAGSVAEAEAFVDQVDLAIFDWQLPDGEGIDLLKSIRKAGNEVPVIMLTARKDIIDKVIGLEIGADDYMVKPYEPRELLARLRLRLKKIAGGSEQKEIIQISGIEINHNLREVRVDDQLIELTKLEYELLYFLAQSPNRVFTRNELLDEVWGMDEMTETRAVDNHIFQLRKKLNKDIFKTIRGIGYRLCPID